MTVDSKFKNLETKEARRRRQGAAHIREVGIAQGRERGGDEKTTQAPCPQHLEAQAMLFSCGQAS